MEIFELVCLPCLIIRRKRYRDRLQPERKKVFMMPVEVIVNEEQRRRRWIVSEKNGMARRLSSKG
jgi:hypothetical protein